MTVDFLITTADGQVNAGSVWLEGGQIRHKASDPEFEELLTNIVDGEMLLDGVKLTAKDEPDKWLEALPATYSGSYLRAQTKPDRATDSRRVRFHRALDRILLRKK